MVLFEHKRFRAAYDFMLLRAESGEPVQEVADWWTSFQEVDDTGKQSMIAALPKVKKRRKKSNKSS